MRVTEQTWGWDLPVLFTEQSNEVLKHSNVNNLTYFYPSTSLRSGSQRDCDWQRPFTMGVESWTLRRWQTSHNSSSRRSYSLNTNGLNSLLPLRRRKSCAPFNPCNPTFSNLSTHPFLPSNAPSRLCNFTRLCPSLLPRDRVRLFRRKESRRTT